MRLELYLESSANVKHFWVRKIYDHAFRPLHCSFCVKTQILSTESAYPSRCRHGTKRLDLQPLFILSSLSKFIVMKIFPAQRSGRNASTSAGRSSTVWPIPLKAGFRRLAWRLPEADLARHHRHNLGRTCCFRSASMGGRATKRSQNTWPHCESLDRLVGSRQRSRQSRLAALTSIQGFSQSPWRRLPSLRICPCVHESSRAGPDSLEGSCHGSTRYAPAQHQDLRPRLSACGIRG